MSTVIWYAAAKRDRVVTPANPPELPAIDFAWLETFLDHVHDVTKYNRTYASSSHPGVKGHGEQWANLWADYRDNNIPPYKDGIYYYDFAKTCIEAYYFLIDRGHPADQRWLNYAKDAADAYLKSNIEKRYQMVYHFPDGLWLAQDAGLLTQQQVIDAYQIYIRGPNPIGGSYWYSGGPVNEAASREGARLLDFFMYYWRLIGMDHPYYKNSTVGETRHYGWRYHTAGKDQGSRNCWEWIREWTESPSYPEHGPYSDPIDYAARAIDVTNTAGISIYNLSPFQHHFTTHALMQLIEQDANYQTTENVQWHNDLTEFNFNNGWFVPTGVPGDSKRYGAYGYRYVMCSSDKPPDCDVIHQYCVQGNGTYWCRNYGPALANTAFNLLPIAYAYRKTGNDKYLNRFIEVWDCLKNNFTTIIQYALNDTWGGKSWNQTLFSLFAALNVMGYANSKTAEFPDGYPYQTPPQVDPTP